jgi:hypothetical protein
VLAKLWQLWKTWNHKSEDILHKLKIKPVQVYIQNNQKKWKERVNRMNTEGILKQILHSAKRIKIIWTSNEGMGGKYETITGHLA